LELGFSSAALFDRLRPSRGSLRRAHFITSAFSAAALKMQKSSPFIAAWLLATISVAVDLSEAPPTISLNLDWSQGQVATRTTDSHNGHRLCHTDAEYQGVGHPGYPSNPNSCNDNDLGDQSRFQQTYAKHCMVSENADGAQNCPGSECTCPEPTAQAFDHHQGQIDVIKTVHLLMRSDPRQMPVPVDVTLADIDYTLRGEYTLRYEAEDSSGNKAENVLFAMVMLGQCIFDNSIIPT
jgi:hypothetical protein